MNGPVDEHLVPELTAGACGSLREALLRGALVAAAILAVMGSIVLAHQGPVLSIAAVALTVGATLTATAGVELLASGWTRPRPTLAAVAIATLATVGALASIAQGFYAGCLIGTWDPSAAAERAWELFNTLPGVTPTALGFGLVHGAISWVRLWPSCREVVIVTSVIAFLLMIVWVELVAGAGSPVSAVVGGGVSAFVLVPCGAWGAARVEGWLQRKLEPPLD